MPQRLSDIPLADLVPETKTWNDGHGIELEAFAGYHGSMELAIAFGEIFWPDFFEFDDCVFRDAAPDEAFMKAYAGNLQSLLDDRQQVERLHNHLHVWDLFPSAAGNAQPTGFQCLYLARLLQEMWEAKLCREFPDRCFRVVVVGWMAMATTKPFALYPAASFRTYCGLVNQLVALNHAKLTEQFGFWNEKEVWTVLQQIIVDQLGVKKEDVTVHADFVYDLRCD